MKDSEQSQSCFEIIIYNDPKTPSSFVSELLRQVFAISKYQAENLALRINKAGQYAFEPYPEAVANALYTELQSRIEQAGHPLLIENLDFAHTNDSVVLLCSFCGKTHNAVQKLFTSKQANICDECVVLSAGQLQELLPTARISFTYQLLDWHFGDVPFDQFVKTRRTYPGRVRADLQTAIEQLFTEKAIRTVGIRQGYSHEKIDLTVLWASGRGAQGIAPISFEEVDVGESEPKKCQINGLWLLEQEDARYAVVLSREADYQGGFKIIIEISGPQGQATAAICRQIFDAIEARISEAQCYRGKVLSLEQSPHYGGSSTGITVHRMEPVARRQVILPETVLDELDRTIIRFCKQRKRLRELGLHTKRGVLLYGAPGTGKTHTIRYLATQLQEHTTFLVTAEQIALLPEYFALARLMQPVIFVIEDADLLAKSRNIMHGSQEEALLNHLLNEMDGLKEDADILFILSTNKPEVLEEALIARPGRIDQLIEFPKPDAQCRRHLMQLYGGSLSIPMESFDDIVHRTEGVTASFIKELMRRLAQYSIERNNVGVIITSDIDQALGEMIIDNNALNRSVLGAGKRNK